MCYAPIQHIGRSWRAYRQARRHAEGWMEMWHRLPPEEQRKWVHPASPNKPPGWSLEEYEENQRRQRGPAH